MKPLMKESEVAKCLAIQVTTLRRWRWNGQGPEFVKVGHAVRYDPDVIEKFIIAGRRDSTGGR